METEFANEVSGKRKGGMLEVGKGPGLDNN